MAFMENSTELKKLFSKGNVAYIKLKGAKEPYLSIIQNMDERYIYLNVPSSFLESSLEKGENVSCQLLDGDYEYVIEGTFEEVEIGKVKTICVMMGKISKYKNNRVFKRYCVNFKAEMNMAGAKKALKAIVRNISIIGVGVIAKSLIHKDSIVSLRLATFISRDDFLEFKAKVVRVGNNGDIYEYGLEIIEIDDRNKDMLDKLIFCLNTNENIFIEDLIKF